MAGSGIYELGPFNRGFHIDANGRVLVSDVNVAIPISLSYVYMRDEKSFGTPAGTFTNGAWRTRDLNTTVFNEGSFASLSGNQITLQPGVYTVYAIAPAFQVGGHQLRLQNITDAVTEILGHVSYSSTTDSISTHVFLFFRLSISVATIFELQHRCQLTKASSGLGVNATIDTEIYAGIKFLRTGDV